MLYVLYSACLQGSKLVKTQIIKIYIKYFSLLLLMYIESAEEKYWWDYMRIVFKFVFFKFSTMNIYFILSPQKFL